MDVAAIQEVLGAFQQLGGDAKQAFIWYLLVAYLPGYLIGLAWTVGGLFMINKAVGIFKATLSSSRLMEAYGTEVYWYPHELDDACNILREAKKSSSAETDE